MLYNNTIKHAQTATPIKQSLVLKGHLFPVFMKYPHELHELGFQREDLLSLMYNLYGQSLFRCRYKKPQKLYEL
jgi:hypothetical protein